LPYPAPEQQTTLPRGSKEQQRNADYPAYAPTAPNTDAANAVNAVNAVNAAASPEPTPPPTNATATAPVSAAAPVAPGSIPAPDQPLHPKLPRGGAAFQRPSPPPAGDDKKKKKKEDTIDPPVHSVNGAFKALDHVARACLPECRATAEPVAYLQCMCVCQRTQLLAMNETWANRITCPTPSFPPTMNTNADPNAHYDVSRFLMSTSAVMRHPPPPAPISQSDRHDIAYVARECLKRCSSLISKGPAATFDCVCPCERDELIARNISIGARINCTRSAQAIHRIEPRRIPPAMSAAAVDALPLLNAPAVPNWSQWGQSASHDHPWGAPPGVIPPSVQGAIPGAVLDRIASEVPKHVQEKVAQEEKQDIPKDVQKEIKQDVPKRPSFAWSPP